MGRRKKVLDTLDENGKDDRSPPVRSSANERERDRMRVLSKAFVHLKTTLPWVPPDTKLSKLDTLRLATCYIAHLRNILAEDGEEIPMDTSIREEKDTVHPVNLTWPYSFTSRIGPIPPRTNLTASCDTKHSEHHFDGS